MQNINFVGNFVKVTDLAVKECPRTLHLRCCDFELRRYTAGSSAYCAGTMLSGNYIYVQVAGYGSAAALASKVGDLGRLCSGQGRMTMTRRFCIECAQCYGSCNISFTY